MLDRPLLFAGPTLTRARKMTELGLHEVEVLPPAGRGDIAAVVARRPPGTMVIVDGVFHKRLAVGHAEIRDALSAGWTVWGVASMGAIRAREMRELGMRGFGAVYDAFCAAGRDMRDDEVSLLHGPGPEYSEMSEPLVHLRAALAAYVDEGAIEAAHATAVLEELAVMYFGDRTLACFGALLARHRCPVDPTRDFDRFRVKSLDLIRFCTAVLASGRGG